MAQTACPFCAYSPIRPGEEACPRCRRRFVDDLPDDTSVTATRAGGITGAVTASPVPVAVAVVALAAAWFLRSLDVVAPLKEPAFLLALPALLIAVAASVMAAAGPAKHLPAAIGVVSAIVAVVWLTGRAVADGSCGGRRVVRWPTGRAVADGAFLAASVGLVVATVSEPSSLRLKGGTVLVALLAGAGLAGLALDGRARRSTEVVVLENEAVGVRWTLPSGWRAVERLDLLLPPKAAARREEGLRRGRRALAR
jgi:hypothetical protein